jgi:cytochrome c oxidase subunit 2
VKERTIFTLVIIALLLVSVGFLVTTQLDLSWLLPTQASSRSVIVDQLFRFMMGIAAVIFLLVEGALLFAVIRFRRREGDEREGAPIHGNNTLEMVWTLIPAILVAVISMYSYRVLTQIEEPGRDPIVVEVIGRQFSWEFRYPQAGISSQELHLPVNRTVSFQISSMDVIHSFWVPAFRVKRDATPGQISEMIVTPTVIGHYSARCAELCGPGHAAMVADVYVESQDDFDTWLQEQAGLISAPQPADVPEVTDVPEGEASPTAPEQAAELGRALFLQFGCGACHILPDAGAVGIVGPTLEGIGATAAVRQTGVEARDYLLQSIKSPDSYVMDGYPASVMPGDYGESMSVTDIENLVEYLLSQ